MHVHNYEKLWLGASLLMIVGFISTIVYGAVGAGVVMVDDGGGHANPSELENTSRFDDPGVEKVGPNEYEANIIAYQFAYKPGTVEVPANSTVTFYVTAQDVVHGFEIAGTNANTMAIPGEVAKVTVEFDEPGEYGIVCHEYCGAGHHGMAGELVVKEPSNFTMQDDTETTNGGNATTNATATPSGGEAA